MNYEMQQDKEFPNEWRSEAIDEHGDIFVVLFSGPEAEQRARQFTDWQNSTTNSIELNRLSDDLLLDNFHWAQAPHKDYDLFREEIVRRLHPTDAWRVMLPNIKRVGTPHEIEHKWAISCYAPPRCEQKSIDRPFKIPTCPRCRSLPLLKMLQIIPLIWVCRCCTAAFDGELQPFNVEEHEQ